MNAPPNWFESFFSGLAVEFWRAVIPPAATAEDVAFLWKHLGLTAGSSVLDVPCGSGRLTEPLARRGCVMTGVDISPEFLAAAPPAPGTAPPIRYRQGDMRDLPWEDAFDAAFCFGNSFGYLDDDGNAAFLRAVARALRTGGRFALDYGQAAESVLPRLEPRQEADVAGFHFAEDTRYDPLTGRIENVFTFTRDGRSETKTASQRVYTVSELARLFEAAGFEVGPFYGSPTEEPFGLASPRLLLVAQKRD